MLGRTSWRRQDALGPWHDQWSHALPSNKVGIWPKQLVFYHPWSIACELSSRYLSKLLPLQFDVSFWLWASRPSLFKRFVALVIVYSDQAAAVQCTVIVAEAPRAGEVNDTFFPMIVCVCVCWEGHYMANGSLTFPICRDIGGGHIC